MNQSDHELGVYLPEEMLKMNSVYLMNYVDYDLRITRLLRLPIVLTEFLSGLVMRPQESR